MTTVKKSARRSLSKAKDVTPTSLPRRVTRKSKTRTPKKELSREKAVQADLVTLPQNASVRSIEKAEAISFFGDPLVAVAMSRIARASGMAFIFVSFAVLLTFYGLPRVDQAALVCSSTGCTTTLSDGSVVDIATLEPKLTLLDAVPSTLTSDTRISFSLTNVTNVSAKLIAVTAGGIYDVQTENLLSDKYRFSIPADTYPPGAYAIRVFAQSRENIGSYSYALGKFTIPDRAGNTDYTKDLQSINEEPTFKPARVAIESPFALELARTNFSGQEAIRINAPSDHGNIEVYIRGTLATQARLLGAATAYFDKWIFTFNSNNLPNGTYELYASAQTPSGLVRTPPATIVISNQSAFRSSGGTSPTNNAERTFYSIDPNSTEFSPIITADSDADAATLQKLQEYEASITDLLKRYAVVAETGDETLKAALEAEFVKQREIIMTDVLLDSSLKDLADRINVRLDVAFLKLQSNVTEFEKFRKNRDGEAIAKDTDKDGVSDFDETIIFKTDSSNSDSDQDGFLDGIEIARGFNPLDPASEALISYISPKAVPGLTRADILEVTAVAPYIESDEVAETTRVHAEIHGKALPLSYVTLYIFSTPTIITVKTDEDGSFVYTFEKELEDGEHEVYIAFTDNTGAIMAKSEPYRFVKKAEAFTPLDAEASEVVVNNQITNTETNDSFRLVVGLGILGFGLILLMLGVGLRSKKETPAELPPASSV
ncbi:MAG: Ig-like domain-containing protein [Patescibacteria group bacterium]